MSIGHEPVSYDPLNAKRAQLDNILLEMGQAAVAFSGGVDSTLLLRVAADTLGPGHVLAITVSSPVHPDEERLESIELAKSMGVRHILVESDELEDEEFASNPANRCYYCKFSRFGELKRIANVHGFVHVLDGSNVDDEGDYRPGQQAAREHGVRSPLQEAGLTKPDIRALSRQLGLPTWDHPSQACLASRFPYGERITREGLVRVNRAEDFLQGLVTGQVRVRHHSNLARIEIEAGQFQQLLPQKEQIVAHLKSLGFTYVTLDLTGFRSGSMNEVL